MPDVSVIIPTYNRRAMVTEAVQSVLAQRGADFELIVVDDGSTDGSGEELDRIAARAGAMRIERTANRGPAAARNRGVALASAPLIAFLDSDDLWAPDKLRRQLAFMRSHPACSISQTGAIWIRDGKRINPGRRHLKQAGDIFVDSLQTCLISPSAVILKTDLFRMVGGFDEDMAAAEDYDLWLRILVDHQGGFLDELLMTRRAGHPDQLSATIPALDRFRILALMKLLQSRGLRDENRLAVMEVLTDKCRIYSNGLRRRGRVEHADFYDAVPRAAASQDGIAKAIAAMRAMLRDRTAAEEAR